MSACPKQPPEMAGSRRWTRINSEWVRMDDMNGFMPWPALAGAPDERWPWLVAAEKWPRHRGHKSRSAHDARERRRRASKMTDAPVLDRAGGRFGHALISSADHVEIPALRHQPHPHSAPGGAKRITGARRRDRSANNGKSRDQQSHTGLSTNTQSKMNKTCYS